LIELFLALRQEHKQALLDLKSRPLTREAMKEWVKAYSLESPMLWCDAYMVRQAWERDPAAARELRIQPGPELSVELLYQPSSSEELWYKQNVSRAMPGRTESESTCVARIKRLWKERQRLIPPDQRYRPAGRPPNANRFRWFVQVQVLGIPPSVVARNSKPPTTRENVNAVCRQIGSSLRLTTPRRFRPGRPNRIR
jgi:hypothetical protein